MKNFLLQGLTALKLTALKWCAKESSVNCFAVLMKETCDEYIGEQTGSLCFFDGYCLYRLNGVKCFQC